MRYRACASVFFSFCRCTEKNSYWWRGSGILRWEKRTRHRTETLPVMCNHLDGFWHKIHVGLRIHKCHEFILNCRHKRYVKSGVCEDGRVLMKTPVLEVEEALKILKPLLHRCSSSLTLRNDLQDMGVYVMSRWILDFLMVRTYIPTACTQDFQRYDGQVNIACLWQWIKRDEVAWSSSSSTCQSRHRHLQGTATVFRFV